MTVKITKCDKCGVEIIVDAKKGIKNLCEDCYEKHQNNIEKAREELKKYGIF